MNTNEDYNISTNDVLTSIKSIDEKLSMAKEGWIDAPVDKKSKWMATIDQILDDRLSLMEIRDVYCS